MKLSALFAAVSASYSLALPLKSAFHDDGNAIKRQIDENTLPPLIPALDDELLSGLGESSAKRQLPPLPPIPGLDEGLVLPGQTDELAPGLPEPPTKRQDIPDDLLPPGLAEDFGNLEPPTKRQSSEDTLPVIPEIPGLTEGLGNLEPPTKRQLPPLPPLPGQNEGPLSAIAGLLPKGS